MKRVYFSGQYSFGNRGCEAIVRSTAALVRSELGNVEILVPSDNIDADSRQWPDADNAGIRFVPAFRPKSARFWVNLQRFPLRHLKQADWPFGFPSWFKHQIKSADAVVSIGGDNYSLDYRIPSPLVAQDALAMSYDVPVYLWGASVGPFEKEPLFRPKIKAHLEKMTRIYVRESASHDYLKNRLNLQNVIRIADPAFTLRSESIDLSAFWPASSRDGVLGINVSPLVERYSRDGQDLRQETAEFIREVARTSNVGILLVPHVMPLDGSSKNNDEHYLRGLMSSLGDLGGRINIAPSNLNASQLKFVIGNLRYFIGARTHATIAALSSGVPTVSIAYSVKARGINFDLFGHSDAILETPDLNKASLLNAFGWLSQNEDEIRKHLSGAIPTAAQAARYGAEEMSRSITQKSR